MPSPPTTLVLVPRKLRDGWLVSIDVSGPGELLIIFDSARRQAVFDAIRFHFVTRRHLYPSEAEAMSAAREIAASGGGLSVEKGKGAANFTASQRGPGRSHAHSQS